MDFSRWGGHGRVSETTWQQKNMADMDYQVVVFGWPCSHRVVGARTLLGAPGLTTRSKKLLKTINIQNRIVELVESTNGCAGQGLWSVFQKQAHQRWLLPAL